MKQPISILWLRQDLRLTDNPALDWALARGKVVPLYILCEDKSDPWPIGGAVKWWLHQALVSLEEQLQQRGSRLILRRGDPLFILRELAQSTTANAVTWNRCYEPHSISRDKIIKAALQQDGFEVSSHNSALLFEPWTIKTQSGTPFRVYTPFSKACFAATVSAPSLATKVIPTPANLNSDNLSDWHLLPTRPDWANGFRDSWDVSEAGAALRLQNFIASPIGAYQEARNFPAGDTTSKLSPYLHWGIIGPRQIWQSAQIAMAEKPELSKNAETFLKEILWREFSYHLLYHFPQLPTQPLQTQFSEFPWHNDAASLRLWQRGQTGYPIVDAGMRQLWKTGWMHNRVRMIVASFLVKHLLQPWQAGQHWFWDTLVDADLASNAASWQWVAGCGADAAPYFRIFNPILQGQKFDPAGDYIRSFVPELQKLNPAYIHAPWEAPAAELVNAGVILGQNYPKPMVEHGFARARALSALQSIKKT